MKNIKLFCLPYAGGIADMIYKSWRPFIDKQIEIIPVELSGRGRRINEPFYKNSKEALDDIYSKIVSEVQADDEYIIYGHSMGAILAFETVHRLMENEAKMPQHLFLSGRKAPNCIVKKEDFLAELPEEEFKNKILNLNGTSKEIFENQILADMFIPILRNDYKVLESFFYQERKKIDIPVTVLSGNRDNITVNEIIDWNKITDKEFDYHILDGNHFFINERKKEIGDIINKKLFEF